MKPYVLRTVAGFVLAGLSFAGQASADSVVVWDQADSFDMATMSFAGISSASVKFDGFGFIHTNGGLVSGTLDLNLNNVWTTVDFFSTSSSMALSDLGTVHFAPSIVTGVRLTSAPEQLQSYHQFLNNSYTGGTDNSAETLTFSDVALAPTEAAPLPSAAFGGVALIGIMGLGARRRTKAKS